jgi:hypothetical protein
MKYPDIYESMIATLDRLMALSQKLHDAERTHDSDPIYVALEPTSSTFSNGRSMSIFAS